MGEKLAVRYRVSPLKARLAGIVHDVARSWKNEELIGYAAEHDIPISDVARAAPVLLHAAVGADIARREYRIEDPELLGAILHHTTAAPNMSDLEKVIYMADTFEPSRKFEGREALEAAAFRSLDEGFEACVRESMKYLQTRRISIARETVELYDQIVRRDAGAK